LVGVEPTEPAFGTFSSALADEELADVREMLMQEGPYTVFVPNNAAFDAYFEGRGITKEAFLASDEVPEIIRAHIVLGKYNADALLCNDTLTAEDLNGNTLMISREGNDFYVNGVPLDGPVVEGTGNVRNGALHFLLGVIEP
jgi:uncharacterized surface protein with fasciclin (FAS1) repeats